MSAHLLGANSTTRNNESASLVQYIQANIPAGDYLVLGGSLSTDSRAELSYGTLGQVVSTSGPHPA